MSSEKHAFRPFTTRDGSTACGDCHAAKEYSVHDTRTIKALTVCQPYAHLIVTPYAELPIGAVRKRVENRRWWTRYKGPLLIHAGKSRKWLRPADTSDFPEMAFGAIVGIADLVDCVPVVSGFGGKPAVYGARNRERYPWLAEHFHTEGPYCWILENAVRFAKPIPYLGALNLFDVPTDLVKAAIAAAGR